MKKILLLQCFLLFSGTMAFSQKELSESPFKNVIGQTLEVDQNKCLYRIEKTDFAFIFHHFFEKPQAYTIVDIIPFHKFVDDQVPEQYKEDWINSLLPSYYPILTLKDKVTGLTNNFISPQKISTENDVLIFQPDSDWLKSFFMLYDNAEVESTSGSKWVFTDCGIASSGSIFLTTGDGSTKIYIKTFNHILKVPFAWYEYRKQRAELEKRRLEQAKQQAEQAEQAKQQAELEKQQAELEKQRKRQALIKKYGTHYVQCIEDKKIELGMPKEIFFEIKDKDFIFRIQESLVHGVRVEIYQEIRAGSALIYGYNKYNYYRFENGKLVSYLYD